MVRRQKRAERPLPPPLPPAERTIGQLVGEAIRLYGANFWKALALGVPVVVVNALAWSNSSGSGRVGLILAAALLISFSYVGAAARVTGASLRSCSALRAYAIGVLVFLPFPVLVTIFVLPGLAWLALLGLAVPAALAERLGAPRCACPRIPTRASGLRPRARRSGHARARRRHLAVQPVLRAARVRRRTRGLPRRHSRRWSSRRSSSSVARSCTSIRRLG